jgi:hypothetical protein
MSSNNNSTDTIVTGPTLQGREEEDYPDPTALPLPTQEPRVTEEEVTLSELVPGKFVRQEQELEEFKEAYFNLLERSRTRIDKKDYSGIAKTLGTKESDPSKWKDSDIDRYFKFVLQKSREHNKKIGEYINRLSDSTRRITELTEKTEKYSTLAEKIKDRQELAKVRSELVDYNLHRQELTKVRSELNEILYSYTNFNDFDIFY